VDRQQSFHSLQFHDNEVLDKQVYAISRIYGTPRYLIGRGTCV
jgi:hypothetical protein